MTRKLIETKMCDVDERLSEICRWVNASRKGDYSEVLSENTFQTWTLKNDLYLYGKDKITGDFNSPTEIQKWRWLESDDAIQTNYLPDSVQWNGGWWECRELVLHAWEDYWGTKGREVELDMEKVIRISDGKKKKCGN